MTSRKPPPPGDLAVVRLAVPGTELAIFEFSVGNAAHAVQPLTGAECVVLAALLRGESNAAIAAARRVKLRTVANQVASVFRKLGVRSRGELAAHWLARLAGQNGALPDVVAPRKRRR